MLLSGSSSSVPNNFATPSQALFIENKGQWDDPSIKYALRTTAGSILMTDQGPVFNVFQPGTSGLAGEQFSVHFDGANSTSPVGSGGTGGVFNYLVGAHPIIGAKTYTQITYNGLYDGVSLKTWGDRNNLKYEFHVAPGADYRQVQISYDNIQGLSVDSKGRLHVKTRLGELVDDAPIVYQKVNGKRVQIKSAFKLIDSNTYTFALKGSYDKTRELVLDPTVDWQTYLGGSAADTGEDISVDSDGNIYVSGTSNSSDFPVLNAIDIVRTGTSDAYVTKYDVDRNLVFSTYFGGSNVDAGRFVSVSQDGSSVFLVGTTQSTDIGVLPTDPGIRMFGAFQPANAGAADAFVLALDALGNIEWSSYFGGSGTETVTGVTIDNQDNLYFTGATNSSNLPVSTPFQETRVGSGNEAYVVKIAADQTQRSILWSSYLGGNADDVGQAIALAPNGDIYVAGDTMSTDLQFNVGPSKNNQRDIFLARISGGGLDDNNPQLVWTRYLGGDANDTAAGIAVNATNIIAVTGQTLSSDLPITPNALSLERLGNNDSYIALFDADAGANYVSYLGGNANDLGNALAIDNQGNFVLVGQSTSTDLPFLNGAGGQFRNFGGGDGLYVLFDGTALFNSGNPTEAAQAIKNFDLYGGTGADNILGVTFDSLGGVYWVGTTASSNLPTIPPIVIVPGEPLPVVPAAPAGANDAFWTRLAFTPAALSPSAPVNLIATVKSGSEVDLSWGDTSNNEEGFKIYRSDNGGPYQLVTSIPPQSNPTGPNKTFFVDTTVEGGTTYFYRVAAYRGFLKKFSNTATAKTPSSVVRAPSGLTAKATSSTSVQLKFRDNSDNENAFEIWRQETLVGVWDMVDSIAKNQGTGTVTYDDTGLTANTQYAYRVRAVNLPRTSAFTAAVVVNTKSGDFIVAPSDALATRSGDTTINITWTDNSTNEAKFIIERAPVGTDDFEQVGETGPNVTVFVDTTVQPGQIYTYRVRAVNADGSISSDPSNTATSDLNIGLLKPTRVEALANSSSQVKITWRDNSTIETGFVIERAINQPSDWTRIGTAKANTNVFYDKHVHTLKRYYYRMRATNGTDFSAYSNVGSARVLPLFVTAPTMPTALRAKPKGVGAIQLSWRDNARDETLYAIERAGTLNGPFKKIDEVDMNVHSYVDSSVRAGKTYYYRVRAYNGGIASSPSNIAKVKATSSAAAKKKLSTSSLAAAPGFQKVTSIFSTQPVSAENDLRKLFTTL
jgi:hypothetical protein